MKRIAVNALVMSDNAGGLGVYITKITDYLLHCKTAIEPVIYFPCNWYLKHPELQGDPRIISVAMPKGGAMTRIVRDPFFWSQRIKKDGIDAFFSPMSYIPLGVNIPSLLTIHDLRSFHEKEYYTFLRYHYLKRMITRSVHKARKIIAVSDYTAKDITERFNIAPEKVRVIYEGIDTEEFAGAKLTESDAILKQYNITAPYILSVGHLEPRKNYIRLIKAYAMLRQRFGIDHQLVIVGQENWLFQEIYQTVVDMGLTECIRFTRFVQREHLPALYKRADVFVTISTFEGFGFTPLESMAAGTPVVVANSTSLPEIAGDAALLCDPVNIEDIAGTLYKVISDTALQKQLTDRGNERIRRFNWKTCCEQTMQELVNF